MEQPGNEGKMPSPHCSLRVSAAVPAAHSPKKLPPIHPGEIRVISRWWPDPCDRGRCCVRGCWTARSAALGGRSSRSGSFSAGSARGRRPGCGPGEQGVGGGPGRARAGRLGTAGSGQRGLRMASRASRRRIMKCRFASGRWRKPRWNTMASTMLFSVALLAGAWRTRTRLASSPMVASRR